ncbi:MAG TPA: ribonuclease III [Acidisarcina sp.]|nr:ribonuclease III [Acidisarcina sp.]
MAKVEELLGYTFHRKPLLTLALTHSSLAYENAAEQAHDAGKASKIKKDRESGAKQDSESGGASDNEQLEFLGDAVLGLLVATSLYSRYPELNEGELTRLRANLVSRRHLGQIGASLQLGNYILLGKGEERSGGRKKTALLANCMEALMGALYLDGGLEAAANFVERTVVGPFCGELRQKLRGDGVIGDHKSALQELLQAQKSGTPEYVVKGESGPDHRKRFLVEVRLADQPVRSKALARGIGSTKKKAEQEAARRAFERLRQQTEALNPASEI